MAIRIQKKLIAFESITMSGIDPSFLGLEEEEIKEYLQKHKMPEDEFYSEEDLIGDLTNSEGIYTLPDGVKEETIDYIEELLNVLAK